MTDVPFDRKEQLEKIQSSLLPDEAVEAVFDMKGGGTGFLGITTKRVLVYDKTFLRKPLRVGRRCDTRRDTRSPRIG